MKEINSIYPQPYYAFAKPLKADAVFFEFEEDFVVDNIRCIPMMVRFKLDACGIKLKLSEWSKMAIEERNTLVEMPCSATADILQYRNYLRQLVVKRTGNEATDLPAEKNPAWANMDGLSAMLSEKLQEFNWYISLRQWRALSNLQRFVLVKLCRPGHENENFPKAFKEFGLV